MRHETVDVGGGEGVGGHQVAALFGGPGIEGAGDRGTAHPGIDGDHGGAYGSGGGRGVRLTGERCFKDLPGDGVRVYGYAVLGHRMIRSDDDELCPGARHETQRVHPVEGTVENAQGARGTEQLVSMVPGLDHRRRCRRPELGDRWQRTVVRPALSQHHVAERLASGPAGPLESGPGGAVRPATRRRAIRASRRLRAGRAGHRARRDETT